MNPSEKADKIVRCATDSEIRDENVVNHSNSCFCYSKHLSVKNVNTKKLTK